MRSLFVCLFLNIHLIWGPFCIHAKIERREKTYIYNLHVHTERLANPCACGLHLRLHFPPLFPPRFLIFPPPLLLLPPSPHLLFLFPLSSLLLFTPSRFCLPLFSLSSYFPFFVSPFFLSFPLISSSFSSIFSFCVGDPLVWRPSFDPRCQWTVTPALPCAQNLLI